MHVQRTAGMRAGVGPAHMHIKAATALQCVLDSACMFSTRGPGPLLEPVLVMHAGVQHTFECHPSLGGQRACVQGQMMSAAAKQMGPLAQHSSPTRT